MNDKGDQELTGPSDTAKQLRAALEEKFLNFVNADPWAPIGKSGCLSSLSYLILFPIACVLPFSPGMLVLALLQFGTDMELGRGQMWTFSILVTLLILLGIRASIPSEEENRGGKLAKATLKYCLTSLGILAGMAVLHFGFMQDFPVAFFDQFFPLFGGHGHLTF